MISSLATDTPQILHSYPTVSGGKHDGCLVTYWPLLFVLYLLGVGGSEYWVDGVLECWTVLDYLWQYLSLHPFSLRWLLHIDRRTGELEALILWYYFTIIDDEIIRDQIIYSLTVKIRRDLAVWWSWCILSGCLITYIVLVMGVSTIRRSVRDDYCWFFSSSTQQF